MTPQTLEGTWEEILRHGAELSGRRVRLTVLTEEPTEGVETLAEAFAGLVGTVDSAARNGGMASRLSEDEDSFGEYLEEKRQEGRL